MAHSPTSQGFQSPVSGSTSPLFSFTTESFSPSPYTTPPPPHPLKHQLKLQERQRLKHPPRPKPGAKQAGCKKPSLPALQHQAPLEKSLPMYPLLTPAAGGQDWF